MRKIVIALGIFGVIMGLLVLAFWIWFPAQRIRDFIAAQGTRAIGAEVRVGAIHPSIVPLGMRVNDLEVANPAGGAAPALLKLGEGSLSVRFAPLFSRRLEITRATLKDLEAVLVMGPDGKLLLPRGGAGGAGGAGKPLDKSRSAPFLFLLSSIELQNGSLRILDPAHSKETTVSGLGARSGMELLSGMTGFRIRGEGEASSFRSTDLEAAGLADGLQNVHLEWDLAVNPHAGTIEITSAKAGTGDVSVTMNGSVTGLPKNPAVNLVFPQQSFDLSQLLPLLPPVKTPDGKEGRVEGKGAVSLDGELRILPERPPEHRLAVALQNLDLKMPGAASPVTGATGLVELTPGIVDIQKLSFQMSGRRMNLAGTLHVQPDSLTTENFRVEAGRTAVSVSAKVMEPRGAKRVSFRARSRLIDLTEFMPAQAPPGGASGAAPPPADFTAKPLIPALPIGSATGTVQVDTLLATGVRIRNARSELTLKKDGLTATLAADSAVANRLPLTAPQGHVTVSPQGAVRIDGATARLYSGKVVGDVAMQIKGPGQVDYQIKGHATDFEANDFLTALTPARNLLYGKMGLNIDFRGSGLTREALLKSISADGDASVTAGRVVNLPAAKGIATLLGIKELEKEIPIRDLASLFEVKDGRLNTQDMKIESGETSWGAAGSVGFDGSLDYAVTLTLSKALTDSYRKRTSLTELFMTPDERMVFDLKIGGTAKDPKVSYDAKKTAARSGVKNVQALLQKVDKGKTDALLEELKKKLPTKPK